MSPSGAQGLEREALVHPPARGKGDQRLALLLALHGSRGDDFLMERYTRFSRLADRRGFVVAYPGTGSQWRDFVPPAGARNVRDFSLLIDVI